MEGTYSGDVISYLTPVYTSTKTSVLSLIRSAFVRSVVRDFAIVANITVPNL
jgi:hypothetical protein